MKSFTARGASFCWGQLRWEPLTERELRHRARLDGRFPGVPGEAGRAVALGLRHMQRRGEAEKVPLQPGERHNAERRWRLTLAQQLRHREVLARQQAEA